MPEQCCYGEDAQSSPEFPSPISQSTPDYQGPSRYEYYIIISLFMGFPSVEFTVYSLGDCIFI